MDTIWIITIAACLLFLIIEVFSSIIYNREFRIILSSVVCVVLLFVGLMTWGTYGNHPQRKEGERTPIAYFQAEIKEIPSVGFFLLFDGREIQLTQYKYLSKVKDGDVFTAETVEYKHSGINTFFVEIPEIEWSLQTQKP